MKTVQKSSTVKTQIPEQSIVGPEAQWTQPWPRVRSQVDVIHLVRSTDAIMLNPHLHNIKSCPEKSKNGDWMHSVMIATSWTEKNISIYGAN